MKSFREFIIENTGRNIYLMLKQKLKRKFGSDKNLVMDQKGKEFHFSSDLGSFALVPYKHNYKLGKYNFEGYDKWFLSVIKKLIQFEQIRTNEEAENETDY